MKTIFDKAAYSEIIERLDNLTKDSQAKWGKMNVNQMLVHCQKPIRLAFGEETVKPPGFFMKLMVKFFKPTLYNDKPWKQGLPTAKEFMINEENDFKHAKLDLKELVTRVHNNENFFKPSKNHPIFGKMEYWMWGQSIYKHLDHHLNQFGAQI
jgi:hypothetical protein